jgi:hypothetical protein
LHPLPGFHASNTMGPKRERTSFPEMSQ